MSSWLSSTRQQHIKKANGRVKLWQQLRNKHSPCTAVLKASGSTNQIKSDLFFSAVCSQRVKFPALSVRVQLTAATQTQTGLDLCWTFAMHQGETTIFNLFVCLFVFRGREGGLLLAAAGCQQRPDEVQKLKVSPL